MDKGDDLQLRYRVFKSFCVPHKRKIQTPSLFCAEYVFVQSFVGGLISQAYIIKVREKLELQIKTLLCVLYDFFNAYNLLFRVFQMVTFYLLYSPYILCIDGEWQILKDENRH